MPTTSQAVEPRIASTPPYDQVVQPRVRADGGNVELAGTWTLSALHADAATVQRQLASLGKPETHWDLRGVIALDEFGTLLLWRAWNWRLPASVLMRPEQEARFAKLPAGASPARARQRPQPLDLVKGAGRRRDRGPRPRGRAGSFAGRAW